MSRYLVFVALTLGYAQLCGAADTLDFDDELRAVERKVIAWRRDIHENPELSFREFRTAALVAEHLRSLGMEVQTGVAQTGVIGTLVGSQPGPIVALRADMDALPVTEQTDLPFASKALVQYNGEEVGVMHACGHDAHVAMLMGAAEILAANRDKIKGTIKFFFQPAEEGAPDGGDGGASLMVKEGVLEGPGAPDVIFGLHVFPLERGSIYYRSRGMLAAADWLTIKVIGRQTHGALPWHGVDPIVVASQIVTALQTIPSRQLDITNAPAIVTIGSIHGGVRGNIIPDTVEMQGTIRTFDRDMRKDLHERVKRTAENIAASAGATAEVSIRSATPVTFNDPDLTRRMLPALQWAAGSDHVFDARRMTGAEDFAFFQEHIPGLFVGLGINKEGVGPWMAPANHSPLFYVSEDALITGVRAMVGLAIMYADSSP